MYIKQLPSDYVHPNGLKMGGYYGLYEDMKLIVAAKTIEDLQIYMPKPDWRCACCGHEFDSESAIVEPERDCSEYAGTRQHSTVNVVCCPECGSDELEQLS